MFPRSSQFLLNKQPFKKLQFRKFTSTSNYYCNNNNNNERIFKTNSISDIEIPKITLKDYLWNNLDKYSTDKTAIECLETGRQFTYNDIRKKSLSLGNFLSNNLKLNRNDTVGVILYNSPEYAIILLGALQAGLRVSTFNPTYTADEIKRQLINSESKIVFTSSKILSTVKASLKTMNQNIQIIEINDNASRSFSENVISFDEIVFGEPITNSIKSSVEDTVFLPYSSGTTGVPKGVQLTHYNIVANLQQASSPEFTFFGSNDDVVAAFLPFFHIYGLVLVLLNGLNNGAKLVTVPKFSTENFIKLLKEYKPNLIPAVPLVVNLSINNSNIKPDDLKCINYMVSGAAPLGAADIERFREKTKDQVKLLQAYGMTEASPLVCSQTERLEHGIKIGGSGLLVPNTIAKIIPTDNTNYNDDRITKGLEPHQTGELLLKGPQIMSGYFNNPKSTEETFIDGWYRTGDIAHYDDSGHLFITDRLKELIKVKGFQVAPAELEEILRDHPKIEDAAVVGVPHEINGEAPKAFVVPKKGVTLKSSEIEEFVAAKVSKHKHLIGGVKFIEEIPKSASGKILRRELKKL